jgi:hypothetical protein
LFICLLYNTTSTSATWYEDGEAVKCAERRLQAILRYCPRAIEQSHEKYVWIASAQE